MDNNELNTARGMIYGIGMGIVIWGIILWVVS